MVLRKDEIGSILGLEIDRAFIRFNEEVTPMQVGIMSRTFGRLSLEEELDAVVEHGISCMQFSLASAGIPELPDHIDTGLCDRIREERGKREIAMAAISGTYNMIHPDSGRRQDGLRRLSVLASACGRLGTSVITLCAGTRDPLSMWRWHPDNNTPEAWKDLVASMHEAVRIAEEHRTTLAVEPEVSLVVDSAQKARRLLDEIGSPYLKIVIDGANIFHKGELPRMREILVEAFALLAEDIVMAHAKDLDRDGAAGHLAAGKGLLDYDLYMSLLNDLKSDVPLILHGLGEAQVAECVAFLRSKSTALGAKV
jgi:sugar phosphate isomerase/epimerase